MLEIITLRALGQNLTMARCTWLDLLDSLKPDSELAKRIQERLAA